MLSFTSGDKQNIENFQYGPVFKIVPTLTVSSAQGSRDETRQLLPIHREDEPQSAIPPEEVTKVALRLKYLIEQCVPCELEESLITMANSKVITNKVVRAAMEAGGKDYGSCVVYCLLVNQRWSKKQATLELWDADLHKVRGIAAEIIAKQM